MGRYFSIKDVFKIISIIIAIIMLSFVLYQFSGVIDVATSQFGGNNNLKDNGLDAIARGCHGDLDSESVGRREYRYAIGDGKYDKDNDCACRIGKYAA